MGVTIVGPIREQYLMAQKVNTAPYKESIKNSNASSAMLTVVNRKVRYNKINYFPTYNIKRDRIHK